MLKIVRVLVVAVLVVFSYSPNAAASMTPDEDGCYFIGYTFDGYNHYSLLKNNSTLIGDQLFIESNCDNIEIYSNGKFLNGGQSNFVLNVPLDTYQLIITTYESNTSKDHVFDNLFFFPSASWGEFLEGESNRIENPITLSLNDLNNEKVMIVIFSSVIIWFISTALIWRVVNFYVDRFHFEEVVN